MDNFIANLKNKIMLPGREEKDESLKRNPPIIPMPDIDNMTASAPRSEPPAQDVSQVQNEETAEKSPSKPSFNVLLKSLVSSEKKEEEPKHVPNPIEDDIFIYYD
ncbi:uncharacterized protein LOC133516846 [Cydia pomonella]|uniref:uncharacterized protein LOC133516846 n=1 Tax=Cydia pomonella TaxID=82600 RepID=UPI002ADE5DE1|nr:uncharacterized protein LOC133516846 [Cydia pomonella]